MDNRPEGNNLDIKLNGEDISINIRNSKPEDNKELIDIFRSYPTSSSLSYVVDRSPDYFELCRLQGNDWKVIVAEKEKIFGSILIAFDKVYLENKEQDIAYTCDLRLDTSVRRTGISDRLMREGVYSCNEKYGDRPNIFTCVLKDNQAGLKKNANLARDNIALMKKAGEIKSYFFLPFTLKRVKDNGYFIRQAQIEDIEEMYELWNKVNSKKNLARVFTYEEFKNWVTNSKGLSIDSYLIAVKENKIVGYFGMWNQSSIRRVIINSEMFHMKLIRNFWNLSKKITKMPAFPEPGQSLNFYNVVNLCIENKFQDCLPVLINHAFKRVKNNNSLFLAIALDKEDPLNEHLKNFYASTSELVMLSNYNFTDNTKRFFHVEIALG